MSCGHEIVVKFLYREFELREKNIYSKLLNANSHRMNGIVLMPPSFLLLLSSFFSSSSSSSFPFPLPTLLLLLSSSISISCFMSRGQVPINSHIYNGSVLPGIGRRWAMVRPVILDSGSTNGPLLAIYVCDLLYLLSHCFTCLFERAIVDFVTKYMFVYI